jgi:PEGA domain/Tetratricopeptide repeat
MRVGRFLVAIACVASLWAPLPLFADSGAAASADDLERARALDQQGVRAFREGRYNDAIRYFSEALKLGGPSSERWNVARCYVKLDQPEAATEALERYLARGDLSTDDRTGARRELEELAHRRSTVTIASSPTGAFVAVDGKRVGKTPTSVDVPAGEHTVAVQREGYPPHLERVVARYGRAIIVDARLEGGGGDSAASGDGEVSEAHRRWFTGEAELGGLFARLGSLGRPIHPAALVSLGYVAFDRHDVDIAVGARLTVTYDSWYDSVGAPALTCNLGGAESATALGVFADGAVGYRPTPRLRIGGDAGLGFASELGSQLGGDAFHPSCNASPGVVPAGHFGAEISYAVVPSLRLVLSPIVFEVLSAFGGTRSTPIDASSAWLRIGGGVGFVVDL